MCLLGGVTMEQWIATSNMLWRFELTDEQYRHFIIEAKQLFMLGKLHTLKRKYRFLMQSIKRSR